MINYSISIQRNPLSSDKPWLSYGRPQVRRNVTLEEFADHIASHGSNYDRADIYAVPTKSTRPSSWPA